MDDSDRHREERFRHGRSYTGYEWLEKHLRKEVVIITQMTWVEEGLVNANSCKELWAWVVQGIDNHCLGAVEHIYNYVYDFRMTSG